MTGARGKGAVKNTTTALKPADDRKVGKRKATVDRSRVQKAKKERKANKDPNKPKRPPSAFVFLAEFRTTFKKENPNVKAVSAVGKAAGEKWKSMSEEDKAPYEAKAQKRKGDYEKQMKDYNKKQGTSANGVADAEEANDEENGASGEDDDEEEDDDD
ncbi:HMG1/2-like protein [Hibiscus syriacus]|uniref:HMG1/2-like protein n=1 Tax=Hibiscus syriacus TaxID=106335 RepID=A0A6A3CGN8_HIBSY|nr:high mobility group B protein 1-like [Hibiscus syriacus]KAE8728545.1 HMG1/2-like protein [Hibiscus syriacus]